MNVAGFLDALCWENILARLLNPPRMPRGEPTVGGVRQVLLQGVIETVRGIIKKEADAVVEELREESAKVTEESVLGMMVGEIQNTVKLTVPVKSK